MPWKIGGGRGSVSFLKWPPLWGSVECFVRTSVTFNNYDKTFVHLCFNPCFKGWTTCYVFIEYVFWSGLPRSVPKRAGEPSRFVYQSGQDCFGRHVVVLLGARLPPLGLQDERTIPLFVKELEALQHETWFKYGFFWERTK